MSPLAKRGLAAQNVAQGVTIEEHRSEAKGRKEVGIHIPDKAEIRAMLEAVSPRWRPLLITLVFTGLRASEARALAWPQVDFKARLIRVRQRADCWGEVGPTKSKAGERDVPMTPMVANTLREWRLACPPSELGLVFPGRGGRPLDHTTLFRGIGTVQVAAGVVTGEGRPKYGPHDLRHFTASWLIEQGFGPKRIMGIMGHASITMSFDVYGHLFDLADVEHDKLAAGELAVIQG